MKLQQYIYNQNQWSNDLPHNSQAQWILAFGDHRLIGDEQVLQDIRRAFPSAEITGCTTSGEIADTAIYDNSLSLTAVTWERTHIAVASQSIAPTEDSRTVGFELGSKLPKEGLQYVFLISNGHAVNGTQLVNGLKESLPENTRFTGGMAGDGDRFETTWVWHNDRIEPGLIVVCGLYGDKVRIGHGCEGGWEPFGPNRRITRAQGNVLYELDDEPALNLYKRYLGEHARNLPASALLFPLCVELYDNCAGVVRTILNIDESNGSMTFAGDMEEGKFAKLMHSNHDRLIDGAEAAAGNCLEFVQQEDVSLAILISCIGRRLILKQRCEDELESVREILGNQATLCGFYSYGEISSQSVSSCSLIHNQTMTITVFSEDA